MKSRPRISFTLFALLAWFPSSAAAQSHFIRRLDGTKLSPENAAKIADAELRDDRITGAQISILNDGRVVWIHTWGLRNEEKHLPMTLQTNTWAASITKPLFATWVMKQVEQHRVELDQPIAQLLERPLSDYPEYGAAADELVRDPRWQHVTVRMMLDHTSGLANLLYLEEDRKLHLHFDPGTRFAYSGEGLNILQVALEHRFRESLQDAMQQEIFAPLHMNRTGMVWRPDFDADSALRYDATGRFIAANHRDKARGAGSMTTSIIDLDRFLEAFLANRIVQPATRAQMLTPQIAIHSSNEFPSLDNNPGTEGEQVGLSYGLGWGLLTRTRYGPAFFKEGHGDGAENYLICFTRSRICMAILTNSDNGELAFRPLLEQLIHDDVTPWEWEGYTREDVLHNAEHTAQ